jgi:hypothetical protein
LQNGQEIPDRISNGMAEPERSASVVEVPGCHAVRAPGVKWTLLALRREGPDGVAIEST